MERSKVYFYQEWISQVKRMNQLGTISILNTHSERNLMMDHNRRRTTYLG